MADNREYISRGEQYGDVYISEDVLAMIAGAAAMEVEGVTGLAGATRSEQLLGRKNLSRGISMSREGEDITINVSLMIRYGSIIPDVAKAVQEAVMASVDATSGLHVVAVNIRVGGITFPTAE